MLKNISPLFSPELLVTIYSMGHGDEIVLADAHFPGDTMNQHVIRADGLKIDALLDAILPLFALDSYVDDPVVMMQVVEGDEPDPTVEASYRVAVDKYAPDTPPIVKIDRFDFYERAKSAFAVVMTGETRKYGNIIIKKGVS
jgi:L-fucose mutarotase